MGWVMGWVMGDDGIDERWTSNPNTTVHEQDTLPLMHEAAAPSRYGFELFTGLAEQTQSYTESFISSCSYCVLKACSHHNVLANV